MHIRSFETRIASIAEVDSSEEKKLRNAERKAVDRSDSTP